jgi:hypothetical protein
MKARMGATRFLTKTLPKVATEMALSVLAYNLMRVINIVGVKRLIAAMGALAPEWVVACPQSRSGCVARITVASRSKSEKYARNDRGGSRPTGQRRPTPLPSRYHAAKTQSGRSRRPLWCRPRRA